MSINKTIHFYFDNTRQRHVHRVLNIRIKVASNNQISFSLLFLLFPKSRKYEERRKSFFTLSRINGPLAVLILTLKNFRLNCFELKKKVHA